jgi:hypothetical protein
MSINYLFLFGFIVSFVGFSYLCSLNQLYIILKKNIYIFFSFVLLSIVNPCSGKSLFVDKAYRQLITKDFEDKKNLLKEGSFFSVFNQKLSVDEREALMFLYAYMPLNDLVDYSGNYFRMNVDYSLKAKREMTWGNKIPDILFRHFVLPIRINNENLDDSRKVFYNELDKRVKGLSMYDAILEVNHWAHEKVVYTSADARTSSPLASMKTAYGRCGEESTFLVAALRAVGIPARQVYTPRWAHTDDNHAWVEAWADGKWFFLGACEPEPVLNLGWFNAPASRGMLMHTKVFGRYNGPEEIMSVTKNYYEINVIDNYAPSAKAIILVVDKAGNPVRDVKVEFKVYNYAEFFTVATKQTDEHGQAFLSAGKGDMLVWASKDGSFGYSKVSFGKQAEVKVVLDKVSDENYTVALDIVPPVEGSLVPEVTAQQRAVNTRRLQTEDSIRTVYTATFLTSQQALAFATKLGLPTEVADLLVASRGNHKTLTDFLTAAPAGKINLAVRLLKLISAKDLRDISREVLDDSFNNANVIPSAYSDMVLNPRVENEMLVPYKSFLSAHVSKEDAVKFCANPQLLVEWCAREIRLDKENNAQQLIMSPVGVWKARVTDRRSRDIFFVSLARSLGIPAWMDLVTGKIKYVDFSDNNESNRVKEVNFEVAQSVQSRYGVLKLNYQTLSWLSNPKYSSHFSISRFDNGTFRLLNYDEEKVTWENTFKEGARMEAGYYMLTTGTRLASGGVLVEVSFFNIVENDTAKVDLVMRENKNKVQVIGSFNSENLFSTLGHDNLTLLKACGRGYYIVAILGVGQEPTNHALRDIAALGKEFEKWGRQMVFLFPDDQQAKRFNASDFPGLPATIRYGIDKEGLNQAEIIHNMKLNDKNALPIFIITDTFNRVVFVSQGYTIGLGEQMMRIVHGL